MLFIENKLQITHVGLMHKLQSTYVISGGSYKYSTPLIKN